MIICLFSKVLVAGGVGFIGSRLFDALISRAYLRALERFARFEIGENFRCLTNIGKRIYFCDAKDLTVFQPKSDEKGRVCMNLVRSRLG